MALETATYISGLNANNPVTATDIVREGSNHLRLVKSTLLNTFPNITGAMTRTHTQLNNAPDASVSSNFSVTDAPDLVDTGNALNIGNLAGAHLAFGPAQVQAKANATTAANLTLNALGGSVDLYSGGALAARTIATGLRVFDTAAAAPALSMYNNTGAIEKARLFVSSDILYLDNRDAESVNIRAWDGAAFQNLLSGNATGQVVLYNDGSPTFNTTVSGANIQNLTGASGVLSVIGNAGSNTTLTKVASSDFEIKNNENSASIWLRGRNAIGTLTNLMELDPIDGFTLYRGSDARITSTTTQITDLHGNASGVVLRLRSNAAVEYGRISATSASLVLRADSEVVLQRGAGTDALTTQNGLGTGAETSYAQVKDRQTTMRDIGYNVMPIQGETTAYTLNRNTVGYLIRKSGGSGDIDITTGATDLAPNGATWVVTNESGAAITIDANTGITLKWQDGAGSTTGDRTLADGGVCTIVKRSASNYLIWGVGLS